MADILRRIRMAFSGSVGPYELESLAQHTLHIQVTDLCNANCVFCIYRKKSGSHHGFMDNTTFRRAVDDFVDLGGRDFALNCTIGEPLLDSRIIDRIRYIRRLSRGTIGLFSNLIHLDQFGIDTFLSSGITRIDVSTTALDAAAYARVYGADLYDRFRSNLFGLLEANSRRHRPIGITLRFRLDITPWNFYALPDVQLLLRRHRGFRYGIKTSYDSWNGAITQDDLTGTMRLRKPVVGRIPCRRLRSPSISVRGDVIACACRVPQNGDNPLVIGSIHDTPLPDVWGNAAHIGLINSFMNRESIPGLCKDCSFYEPWA